MSRINDKNSPKVKQSVNNIQTADWELPEDVILIEFLTDYKGRSMEILSNHEKEPKLLKKLSAFDKFLQTYIDETDVRKLKFASNVAKEYYYGFEKLKDEVQNHLSNKMQEYTNKGQDYEKQLKNSNLEQKEREELLENIRECQEKFTYYNSKTIDIFTSAESVTKKIAKQEKDIRILEQMAQLYARIEEVAQKNVLESSYKEEAHRDTSAQGSSISLVADTQKTEEHGSNHLSKLLLGAQGGAVNNTQDTSNKESNQAKASNHLSKLLLGAQGRTVNNTQDTSNKESNQAKTLDPLSKLLFDARDGAVNKTHDASNKDSGELYFKALDKEQSNNLSPFDKYLAELAEARVIADAEQESYLFYDDHEKDEDSGITEELSTNVDTSSKASNEYYVFENLLRQALAKRIVQAQEENNPPIVANEEPISTDTEGPDSIVSEQTKLQEEASSSKVQISQESKIKSSKDSDAIIAKSATKSDRQKNKKQKTPGSDVEAVELEESATEQGESILKAEVVVTHEDPKHEEQANSDDVAEETHATAAIEEASTKSEVSSAALVEKLLSKLEQIEQQDELDKLKQKSGGLQDKDATAAVSDSQSVAEELKLKGIKTLADIIAATQNTDEIPKTMVNAFVHSFSALCDSATQDKGLTRSLIPIGNKVLDLLTNNTTQRLSDIDKQDINTETASDTNTTQSEPQEVVLNTEIQISQEREILASQGKDDTVTQEVVTQEVVIQAAIGEDVSIKQEPSHKQSSKKKSKKHKTTYYDAHTVKASVDSASQKIDNESVSISSDKLSSTLSSKDSNSAEEVKLEAMATEQEESISTAEVVVVREDPKQEEPANSDDAAEETHATAATQEVIIQASIVEDVGIMQETSRKQSSKKKSKKHKTTVQTETLSKAESVLGEAPNVQVKQENENILQKIQPLAIIEEASTASEAVKDTWEIQKISDSDTVSNFDIAHKQYNKAKIHFSDVLKVQDPKMQISENPTFVELASKYHEQKLYREACKLSKIALETESLDVNSKIDIFNILASSCLYLADRQLVSEYANAAVKILESDNGIGDNIVQSGQSEEYYMEREVQFENLMTNVEECVEVVHILLPTYRCLGVVRFNQARYTEASRYFNSVLSILEELPDVFKLSYTNYIKAEMYNSLVHSYYRDNQYDECIKISNEWLSSIESTQQRQFSHGPISSCLFLAEIYGKKGDFVNAQKYAHYPLKAQSLAVYLSNDPLLKVDIWLSKARAARDIDAKITCYGIALRQYAQISENTDDIMRHKQNKVQIYKSLISLCAEKYQHQPMQQYVDEMNGYATQALLLCSPQDATRFCKGFIKCCIEHNIAHNLIVNIQGFREVIATFAQSATEASTLDAVASEATTQVQEVEPSGVDKNLFLPEADNH